MLHRALTALSLLFILLVFPAAAESPRRTRNVIVVTLDGFRWQELFDGADESLMDTGPGGVRDVPELKSRYLRQTVDARREALLPFFWNTVARQGQVFGNAAKKSAAKVTNGLKFSYPGYSEMFCGLADARVDSNAKRPNPNLSVLEFLNGRPGFENRVEAVCTWDVFPSIFRSPQSGLRVQAGWQLVTGENLTDHELALNELMDRAPKLWANNTFDVFTMGAARSALTRRGPRVLHVGLGETDEWGHARRYDLYLEAAHKADRFLAETWKWLQNNPNYKDRTTLLITTDHGRGGTRANWTDHGKNVEGAELIWIAVIGPDTPALGEREAVDVTQSQVAATIAALVGEDFGIASPQAAKPLPVFDGP